MKIEVFYDSLCSWCRVGKVNLHKAIDKLVAAGKIKEEDIISCLIDEINNFKM